MINWDHCNSHDPRTKWKLQFLSSPLLIPHAPTMVKEGRNVQCDQIKSTSWDRFLIQSWCRHEKVHPALIHIGPDNLEVPKHIFISEIGRCLVVADADVSLASCVHASKGLFHSLKRLLWQSTLTVVNQRVFTGSDDVVIYSQSFTLLSAVSFLNLQGQQRFF